MAQRRNGLMVSTRLSTEEYQRFNKLAEASGSNSYQLLREMIQDKLEAASARPNAA